MIPKKLAVINDMAGYGRCSLTIALPVISTMKVQACPVPTSVFSNHTGFPDWFCQELTEQLPDYFEKWQNLGLTFDGIYCGYLGSVTQIDIISDFIDSQKAGQPLILIDPVMGDHGQAYRGITTALCERMKDFIRHAHILTPNLTEACLLTDTPYQKAESNPDIIVQMLHKLHGMGPAQIIITGVQSNDFLNNYIFGPDGTVSTYKTPVAGPSRPGTGDLFASILSAACLNGVSLFQAVKTAADFIGLCICETQKENVPIAEGVCFENHLSILIPR